VRSIVLERLDATAFAPFGEVLNPPRRAGRAYFERALANRREKAWPSLSLARIDEVHALPLEAVQMERHPLSSQSFVPLGAVPFVVAVAPHGADGRPDTARARAFLAENGQGVTYAADTWHHPLTVLGAVPAGFAVWMWRDGTAGDEEFVDIDPFRIVAR
jgi:ureidoglycolate lyase